MNLKSDRKAKNNVCTLVIEFLITGRVDFSSKCTKMRSAGLRPNPLGELTALSQTP